MTDFGLVLREQLSDPRSDWTLTVDGDRRLWPDVIRQSLGLAAGMRNIGITPRDHVALVMDTSHDAIESWFAASEVGCMDVPLNVHYQGELLHYLLDDSDSTVVCCDARHLQKVLEVAAGTAIRRIVVSGKYDGAATVDGVSMHRIDELRSSALPIGDVHGETSAGETETESAGEGGVILYTSGTTGPSKGVLHSQASCLALSRYNAVMNGYAPGDTLLNFFPLYHQNARYTGVAAALVSGASMQLDSKFSSSRFWNICREGHVTAFNYLGSVLDMILRASTDLDASAARDHSVTRAWGAGADPETWTRFEDRFGVVINEVYGLTEAPMATVNFGAQRAPAGSAGKESDLFEVKVADQRGRLLSAGETGEIVVRPKGEHGFMLGYYGRDDATVSATQNLWFHTGDAGWLAEDGALYFMERTTDSVRRRGENISLWEIESAVSRQQGVLECAAFGVDVGGLDDELMVALVVADAQVDHAVVLRAAAAELPPYAVPRFLRVVGELPHTDTMKVQKQVLRSEGITPDTVDLREIFAKPSRDARS
jgi:crotonobetaine/carnitine-CoA ligase